MMITKDIHLSRQKIESSKRQLAEFKNGQLGASFLDAMIVHGISEKSVGVGAWYVVNILRSLDTKPVRDWSKEDVQYIVKKMLERNWSNPVNFKFLIILKRFVSFAKQDGTIVEKRRGMNYSKEVDWIAPTRYIVKSKERRLKAEDLLTGEEFLRLVQAVPAVSKNAMTITRDQAMLYAALDAAMRPGELLSMTVGSVIFDDRGIVTLSVSGKTGPKVIPSVLAYRPLLDWIEVHPRRNDKDAPLWYSKYGQDKVVTYKYLKDMIKKSAHQAGITKKVFWYLLRHQKLTEIGAKYSDQILKQFAAWSTSKMAERYVHLSSSNIKNILLKEHDLINEDEVKSQNILKTKTCPRCAQVFAPHALRCKNCNIILDQIFALNSQRQKVLDGTLATNDIQELKKDYAELKELVTKLMGELG